MTMNPSENTEWVRKFTGMSIRQLALNAGADPSSFDKRIKRGIDADLIIEISKASGADPIEGLRRQGFIPSETADTVDSLLAEAARLIKRARQLQAESAKTAGTSNVTPICKNNRPTEEEIVEEANEYPTAAQERTDPLEEPESP